MLFIVPGPEETAEGKAPSFKVELDLDDAPFLEEPLEEEKKEEAPPEPETTPVPVETKEEEEEKPSKLQLLLARLKANKKKLILAGGASAVLLIAFIVVNKFIFGPPAEKVQPTGPKLVTVQTQPKDEADPNAPAVYVVNWEPFLVELRGSEGEIRFLYCQFSTPTTDPVLHSELLAKKVALRDAVYYYLKRQPLTFLSDSTRQGALKEDIINVINEHVSSAKISELYFEEYVVRGS